MPSKEFLEEMLEQTKQYLPKWLYVSLVQAARPKAGGKAKANRAKERLLNKAKWTNAFINDLPDSSFLFIESGGEKDEDNKTVPRDLRHFPIRNKDGELDLPHLRNALARIDQSNAPGLDKDNIRSKAQQLLERAKENQVSKALISFVVSEYSAIENARGEALVGDVGVLFKEKYLDPLGIDRDDIHITINKDTIGEVNPHIVVALGKKAKQELCDLADFTLPHPAALVRHGDSGEVGRKLRSIHKILFDRIDNKTYFNDCTQWQNKTPIVEYKADRTSVNSQIIKSAPEKRIVYGVVVDPYGSSGPQADAHNDWMPPDEVERMAHGFMLKSRVIRLQHREDAEAQVVESSVEQYPSREEYLKALKGEPHRVSRRKFGDDIVHSGSWILGVQFGEKEWDLYKQGKINAFSPGGTGIRKPLSKSEMPKVEFVDLVEK